MSQIALPLDVSSEARCALPDEGVVPTGFEAEGFRIGWEYARYQTTPPADHLHAGHPVRQGWEAGRVAFAGRTLAPSRAARLWMELRLQAWLRGRAFDAFMVTPRFVAQIDARQCPVTQVRLTHSPVGMESATDAVLMPLFDGAACAAGNIAVVSRRVAQARGALSHEEMSQIVLRLQPARSATAATLGTEGLAAAQPDTVSGLDLQAWRRLQALTSLATPLTHDQAAAQALHLLPPPRVRLLNPVQALQALLTTLFTGPGYARQLTDLGALMPHAQARRAYFLFMNAMLARRLSARGAEPQERVRVALEQAWGHPLVLQRWQALAQALTPAQASRVVRQAVQRGLGVASGCRPAWRWTDEAAATEGWALETGGRVGGELSAVPVSAPAVAPASGPVRSGVRRPSAAGAVPRGAPGRPTAPSRRPARDSV